MQQNVYIISLVGIGVVFLLLMALYFIMKAFKYLPTVDNKAELQRKKKKTVKKKVKPADKVIPTKSLENQQPKDNNIVAIITVLMAKKGISQDRITIKKIGG